jgi:hypothetical protein
VAAAAAARSRVALRWSRAVAALRLRGQEDALWVEEEDGAGGGAGATSRYSAESRHALRRDSEQYQ